MYIGHIGRHESISHDLTLAFKQVYRLFQSFLLLFDRGVWRLDVVEPDGILAVSKVYSPMNRKVEIMEPSVDFADILNEMEVQETNGAVVAGFEELIEPIVVMVNL